jgi:hypothetical protein
LNEWCTSDADVLPEVATADAKVAMARFTTGCPLGCGSGNAKVETEAETWFASTASRFAFSFSNDMVFVLLPHLPQYHQSILAMLNLLGTLSEAGKLLELVTITILLSPIL